MRRTRIPQQGIGSCHPTPNQSRSEFPWYSRVPRRDQAKTMSRAEFLPKWPGGLDLHSLVQASQRTSSSSAWIELSFGSQALDDGSADGDAISLRWCGLDRGCNCESRISHRPEEFIG